MNEPTPSPTLHPEIVTYLTTHKGTIAEAKRQLHDAILTVHRIAAQGRRLALEMRTDLHEAEYAAHNDTLDNRYNFMHTRINEVDCAALDLEAALKRMAKALRAIEEGHEQDHGALARIIESNPRG